MNYLEEDEDLELCIEKLKPEDYEEYLDDFTDNEELENIVLSYIKKYENKYKGCSHKPETIAKKLNLNVKEVKDTMNKLIKEKKLFFKMKEKENDSSKFYRVYYTDKLEQSDNSLFLIVPKEILELDITIHNKIILSKLFKLYRNNLVNNNDRFNEFSLDSYMNDEYKSYDISLKQLRDISETLSKTNLLILDKTNNTLIPTDTFKKMSYEKNFLKISETLLNNKKISDCKKIIIAYFMSYTSDDKTCFSKYDTIIEKLGVSKDMFYKTLREIKNSDLITLENHRFKSGKIGRAIKLDESKIENYYENIENVYKAKMSKVKNIENVEEADIYEINNAYIKDSKNIENIEKADISKVENVQTVNTQTVILNSSRISDDILKSMDRETLNKVYFETKDYIESIKKIMNQKVDD